MYPASPTAYDRAITVFSPDGRLFQVEYAREAVKMGTTTIGMVFDKGVLIMADKNVVSRLMKEQSLEKIYAIDEHILAGAAGITGDARKLVDYARIRAQRERYTYGEPIDVELLTKEICDLKQAYTQWGGTRPFGAALIIAGVDNTGKRLFETDPSGAYAEYYATAIGTGFVEIKEFFEKYYVQDISFEEAIKLSLKALTLVKKKITPETIDMAYIMEDKRCIERMEKEKLKKFIERIEKSKR